MCVCDLSKSIITAGIEIPSRGLAGREMAANVLWLLSLARSLAFSLLLSVCLCVYWFGCVFVYLYVSV